MPPALPRRLAVRAASLFAVLLGAVTVMPATAAADEVSASAYGHYVAIGDSFVAGPMVTSNRATAAMPLFGCMQSSSNYPAMLAERLDVAEFTDASCSGAVINDLYEQQFSYVLPQLDALTPETDLVTVGISGNDFGFSEVFVECAKRSLSNPLGNPCERHYGDGLSQRIEGLRGEVATVYADIAERSPKATVLAVGYLQILPERTGCWPSTPVAVGDVPYLDRIQTELNTMIKEEATAQGAVFVDVMERGHDVCKGSGTRWVEGLIPENGAPLHPNRLGMEATADFVSARLGVPVGDA